MVKTIWKCSKLVIWKLIRGKIVNSALIVIITFLLLFWLNCCCLGRLNSLFLCLLLMLFNRLLTATRIWWSAVFKMIKFKFLFNTPCRDSSIRGAIVRIVKTNAILKRPVNQLFTVEKTYHDTKQTDKVNHKEIASDFPCCLVNCEYSWKKTQI